MWSERRVFSSHVVLILGLLVALVALAMVMPAGARAASDDGLPIALVDQTRRPTVVQELDQAGLESWVAARAEQSVSDVQLATLAPWVFLDQMESGVGGWTADSPWAITTEWQPYSWMEDNHSWSDSPGGNYSNDAVVELTSQIIDLSAAGPGQGISVDFSFSSVLEEGNDFVFVEFSANNGSSWNYYSGDDITGIYEYGVFSAEIPAAMRTDQFRFRIVLKSDSTNTYDGVHIDHIGVDADWTEYVEEDDARLAYLGEWSVGSATTPYDDPWDYKYTSTPGDLIQISFNGPALWVYGKNGTSSGIAAFSVDGGTPQTVDLYSTYPDDEEWPGWVVGYSSGLSDGPHTLTICCTGTKNPASSGYEISFANAYIFGAATTAPGAMQHEETDALLEYFGSWTPTPDPGASGSAITVVDEPIASVNVAFEGKYLAWNAKKGPGYGKAKVSVDGGTLKTVDLYNAWDSSKKRVYDTGLLANGPHTVSIYWSGEKNASASSTKIDVDSFDVLGSLIDADMAEPLPWRYQQSDAEITYLGDWTTNGTWSASGGSYASTSQAGAAAIVQFTGASVDVRARTTAWSGEANIYLDGALVDTVDLYSASTAWKVPVYTNDVFNYGEHTLIVECTGEKNGSSAGTSVNLDALDIGGYLDPAPAPIRVDDNDGSCTNYTPAWSRWDASGYWAAFLDTYAFTDQETYRMTVAFEGTHLSWVSRTANTQGKAKVTLDGNDAEAQIIDLYSSGTSWKKRVYSTGILADTCHYVTIECLGEKNPSSWWYTIGVDAFDIMGAPAAPPPPAPLPTRHQQTDTKITYLGGWATANNSSASGLSYASSSQQGAVALAEFTGTEVNVIASTGPSSGIAFIYIDGSYVDYADLYSASTVWKVPVYVNDTLTDTTHTIAIECSGDKHTSSNGTAVNLDALDVLGTLAQADTPTRVDDNDGLYATYDTGWSRWDGSGYWAAYLDTYAFTDQATYKVTVTFHGTHFSWVSRYSNTQGKAKVTLDGNTSAAQTIDLYSPTTMWKKRVYSTGFLYDGYHTVVIECLGTKNPSSWWHTVGVDAFDILETAP